MLSFPHMPLALSLAQSGKGATVPARSGKTATKGLRKEHTSGKLPGGGLVRISLFQLGI
jgi:hypothetical protein